MKVGIVVIVAVAIGLLGGWYGGWCFAKTADRAALLSGPYSDNFGPALRAIAEAKAKLQSRDTNVLQS